MPEKYYINKKTHLATEKKFLLHYSLKINKRGVIISYGGGAGKKQKISKRLPPFIRHLRVCIWQAFQDALSSKCTRVLNTARSVVYTRVMQSSEFILECFEYTLCIKYARVLNTLIFFPDNIFLNTLGRYLTNNILQSFQGLFGILTRAAIYQNSLANWINAFVKNISHDSFFYLKHFITS